MKKNLYQILGVAQDASAEQIRQGYEQANASAVLQASNDANHRVALQEAYSVLSNPQRRAAYDASLRRQLLNANLAQARQEHAPKDAGARSLFMPALVLFGLFFLVFEFWWKSKHASQAVERIAVVPSAVVQKKPTAINPSINPAKNAVAQTPIAENKSAEQIYAERAKSIALIQVLGSTGEPIGIGSGVVIEPGLLITNCHVAKMGTQYKVKIGNDTLPAKLVMADEEFDLCRLSIAGSNAPAVSLGSVDALHIGQKVFAIGAPQGLDLTISDGIVSSLRPMSGSQVIQTTAPISPGSSGGGLFDANGNLVGIVTFQNRVGQNLNFAVPVDWIRSMSERRNTGEGIGGMLNKNERPISNFPVMHEKIAGSWQCFGALTGYGMELTFFREGRVTGTMDRQPMSGNFNFDGKRLQMSGGGSFNAIVEEFTERKMVLNAGNSARLVCNRR